MTMFTIDDVRKKADELHARRAQELKDLDVDRVDGVDKPATGRNFLLFKGEGNVPAADVLRLRAGAAKLKAARKSMFADVMIDPATREYPVESQEVRTGPRVADEGEDALGRAYDDGAYDRLAGANGRGSSRATGLPDGEQENFAADQGGELVSPPEQYRIEEDAAPVSLPGGMRLLNPQASGIPDAAGFLAPRPAQVAKRKAGLFRDVILDPMAGASRHSSFFDDQRDDAKVKKDGGSLFRNVVYGE
jgi:hypothetical protein